VSANARVRPRLGWLDCFILPAGTPIAPSRWHQHIVQRRLSRLDHLRPHRLNWDALKHPELAAGQDDDTFGFRVIFGASGAGRLLGILLFVWLAVWPALRARGGRPAPAPAGAE
jgi:hypothetical protein